jgi:MFS family permease
VSRATGSKRWWALAALAVAMLTVGLDSTVLTVALPTLARDLHASTSQLQWFSSAYTLVLAAVLLPAGALGDRVGRKRLLLAGLAVFAGASVWCAYWPMNVSLVHSGVHQTRIHPLITVETVGRCARNCRGAVSR